MKYTPIYDDCIVIWFWTRTRSLPHFSLFPFLIFRWVHFFFRFVEEVFCALPQLNGLITTDVTELFTCICTQTIVTAAKPHETAPWAHIIFCMNVIVIVVFFIVVSYPMHVKPFDMLEMLSLKEKSFVRIEPRISVMV